MHYLREHFDDISKEDYLSLRESLDLLNNSIHYFDEYKLLIFNFHFFISLIKKTRNNLMKIDKLKKDTNDETAKILTAYQKAYISAFLWFTPFFEIKLCFHMTLIVLKLIVLFAQYIGLTQVSKLKSALDALINIEERRVRYAL
jgi:hypothetical protein